MRYAKHLLWAYVAGMLTALGGAMYCGADAVIQAGLKLAAIQTSYDYDAVPRPSLPVSYDTQPLVRPEVAVIAATRKGKR